MNCIFKVRFALVSGLILLGMFAAGSASGQPCVYDHTDYNCLSNGWVTLIAPTNNPIVCLGDSVTISADKTIVDDGNETVTYYRNTTSDATPDEMPGWPVYVSYGNDPPTYSVTWTASVGSWSTNGTGLTASFTPGACGNGTVDFTCNYTNQNPCTNTGSTGSSGTSGSFTVLSLNIADGSGKTISTANSNDVAIVGQGIGLSAQTCGGTFSNFQWTVAGYAVAGYDVGAGVLTTDFPTTNSTVGFYWVDSGSKQVSCSAVCGGVTCSTNVTFTVVTPTATLNPVTTGTSIFGDTMEFASDTNNGITFYNSLSVPTNFSGFSVFSQTISLKTITRTESNGTVHNWTNACSPLFGDLPTPYQANLAGTTNFTPVDSPSVGLPAGYKSVSRTTNFRMTMLFQPPGGIAVPMLAVDWSWQASAATNGVGVWTITSSTNSPNPAATPTTTFPQWNCASQNGGFN
jgi:hypothetical protein